MNSHIRLHGIENVLAEDEISFIESTEMMKEVEGKK